MLEKTASRLVFKYVLKYTKNITNSINDFEDFSFHFF